MLQHYIAGRIDELSLNGNTTLATLAMETFLATPWKELAEATTK
jgi:hypothetical protein